MNKENASKLWKIIQEAGDYLVGQLPDHPNHPKGRNPYAHVAICVKSKFNASYKDIPDEKYDVLEAQSEKITEREKKLNEEMGKVIDLKNSNSTLVREQVISETTTDLTDTEIEKFKSLTEDVEFTDGESFKEKLDTLKESYFPKTKPVETKTVNEVETGTAQDIYTKDSMKAYMTALGKYGNK